MLEPRLKLCIVQESNPGPTFVRVHATRLPYDIKVVHGLIPCFTDHYILSQNLVPRALRKIKRLIYQKSWDWEVTSAYLRMFRRWRPDVVLAEFGPTAVKVMEACRLSRIPLVAHFHGGFDVGCEEVVSRHSVTYPRLFQIAKAVVAVSEAMKNDLLALGARPDNLHCVYYGIDSRKFVGGMPELSAPVFIAIGQFIDFKAPYLTILAFEKVFRLHRNARLRLVGDGPLLPICMDIVRACKMEDAVCFLGNQPHDTVAEELRNARCFVQHSVIAASGNREGTPVAILEASMTGLPVISTRHQGIPEVVMNGKTGYLVDEGDIDSMATHMIAMLENPELAGHLGKVGRRHALLNFDEEKSLRQLGTILESSADRERHKYVEK